MSWSFLAILLIGAPIACVLAVFKLAMLIVGTDWSQQHERGAGAHARIPQTRSRFLPGLITGIAVCLVLGIVSLRFYPGTVVPGVATPAERVTTAVDESDVDILVAEFRDQTIGEPIPVTAGERTSSEKQVAPSTPDKPVPSTEQESVTGDGLPVLLFEDGTSDGTPAEVLPEWTKQEGNSRGLPSVIVSPPNATIETAEADALALLAVEVGKAFVADHPEAAGWTPPVETVRNAGVIGRRAIRKSDLAVGDFIEPVFEAYLEVVPPPDLESNLASAWRAETVSSRLLLVGSGLGLLTLMFGTLAGYFRIDDATRGRYRNQLRVGTAVLWVAAGTALAFVA